MKKQFTFSLFIMLSGLLLSFVWYQNGWVEPESKPPVHPKLEHLYRLPKDTVLDYYDLSYQRLTEVPDLSQYHIRHLNLSHNRIEYYGGTEWPWGRKKPWRKFPKGVEIIDLSHNRLRGLTFENDSIPQLKAINASHNELKEVVLNSPQLEYCNLSHNDIFSLSFRGVSSYYRYEKGIPRGKKPHLRHLDISHNPSYVGEGLEELSGLDTISCSKCSTDSFIDFVTPESGRGCKAVFCVDTLLVKKKIKQLRYKVKVIQ